MKQVQNILIISSFFYPEISPRAFRTTELVREFAKRGKNVTLIIPNREIYHRNPLDIKGVTIIYASGEMQPMLSERSTSEPIAGNGQTKPPKKTLGSRLPKWLQSAILYFYSHELFAKYDTGLLTAAMQITQQQDMVISISYPCAVHLVTSRAVAANPALCGAIKIAEFSDPPMRDSKGRFIFGAYKSYLRHWGRTFDYFVTPVEKAVECYSEYIDNDRIKVIPQGFDFSSQPLKTYVPNPTPTFVYAGRFYENIRDPKYFFDYLKTLDCNFRFDLFLIHLDPCFEQMINAAQQQVKGEIVVHKGMPREQLIEQLSGYDFLVNFDNSTSNASPSKLIDYAIAKRPILSFNEKTFKREVFEQFMLGDYSEKVDIDVSPYDIRVVVDNFLKLTEPKDCNP